MSSEYKVGTCTDMCPKAEVRMRIKNELLDPLEKLLGVYVKAYSRSAAGAKEVQPSSLRTPETCLRTAKFLVEEVIVAKSLDLNTYVFILDRLRSVRQDLIIQNINNEATVRIYELCIKFLLLSGYEFCDSGPNKIFKYDPRQNYDQLRDCLKTLISLYVELDYYSPESPNMISSYLLLDLESSGPHLWLLSQGPSSLRKESSISAAESLLKAYRERNFVALLKILPSLSIPGLLALQLNFNRIYRSLFEVMISAYGVSSCQYPFKDFCRTFCLQPLECTQLLMTHCSNLALDDDDVPRNIPFRKNTLVPVPKAPLYMKLNIVKVHLLELNNASYFTLSY